MLRIQARDEKLFSKLLAYEVLSTEKIGALVFPGIAPSTVLRRLRALEEGKWIFRQPIKVGYSEVWSIDRFGAAHMSQRMAPYPRLNRQSLFRARALSEIRLSLEGAGLVENWSGARELRLGMKTKSGGVASAIPDAVFIARQRGIVPVPVSMKLILESTRFSETQKALSRFAKIDSLPFLWFISERVELIPLFFAQWGGTYRATENPTLLVSALPDLIANSRLSKVYFEPEKSLLLGQFFGLSTPENRTGAPTQAQKGGELCP